jgi:myo-inositol-1(or 4)-monophosphatase
MNYNTFLQKTLNQATKIAAKNFGKVSESTKTDDNNQVLTETDIEIGELIVSQIEKAYPNHNIIDEEAGVIDKKSRFTWVVDPIDGTSNFSAGLPAYCIMIGLLDRDVPIAGGIALPASNEICLAEKERGAFCNGRKIHVSFETNLLKMLVSYGIDAHQENPDFTRKECSILANIILNIRNLRASNSNYDAILVAKGKYGAWLNQTMKIWDNVAPQVIIQEAGGLFTDFFGKKIDYSNPINKVKDNFTVCAAAPILHNKLQEIIHQR